MTRLSWLSGGTETAGWADQLPRLRRPAQIIPWRPSDGYAHLIERRDADSSMFFRSPASWTPSWRAATQFTSRRAANAAIRPKCADAPAGPAAERGARVMRIGPWLDRGDRK